MKVITFGELMLRLAPFNYLRFVQSDSYEATFGGAEANVAVSLANYGIPVSFVSKLPAHEIGQCAINSLRKFGVDTSLVVRGGERLNALPAGLVANALVSTTAKRAHLNVHPRLSTTALTLPSPQQFQATSIGTKFSKTLIGSTLQVSHQH